MTTQQQRLDPNSEAAFLSTTKVETTEAGSPLRHFKGDITDFEVTTNSLQGGGTGHRIKFKFVNLVVTESISPWPWDVGELSFSKNGDTVSPNSALGILFDSITNVWGAGKSIGDMKGHNFEIKFTPGHKVRRPPTDEQKTADPNAQWQDVQIEAYEVIAVDGQGKEGVNASVGSTPTVSTSNGLDDLLTVIANGKQQSEFQEAALTNARVQGNETIFNQLMNSPELVLSGLIAKEMLEARDDSGVITYHKVTE